MLIEEFKTKYLKILFEYNRGFNTLEETFNKLQDLIANYLHSVE